MTSCNFSLVEPYMSEEISFDFPGVDLAKGKKRVLLLINIILRKYSELKFEVRDIIVEGERAVAVWTNKGEAKSGEAYQNSGLTLFEFTDGKINFMSDYFKDTSFIKQFDLRTPINE